MFRRASFAPAAAEPQFLKGVAEEIPDEVARVRALPKVNEGPSPVVIIIGAGAAGLCAAVEMEALGWKVEIFEAERDHIGGRIRTHSMGPDQGELGAMRIPAVHMITRHYVKECALTLRPFINSDENAFFHVRGQRSRVRDVKQLWRLFALTDAEAALGDTGLWQKSMTDLANGLSEEEKLDVSRPRPRTERVLSLDRESLYSRFRAAGLSAEAIQLIASLWNLETSLHIGLLEHLREELKSVWAGTFDEISGGMSRLPEALARRLVCKIRTASPVVRVEQDASVITAFSADGTSVSGDYLICSAPLGAMKKIEFRPPLTARKNEALRRMNYDSSTKVLALASRRFWETDDGIYGGCSISDGPLGSTHYPSDNPYKDPDISNRPSVFLASYTWGQMARRMAAGTTKAEIVRELAKFHHSLRDQPDLIEDIKIWAWDEHDWSEGAYAFAMPGEQTEFQEAVDAAEGRMIIAGEHAGPTHAWIQGALQSGLNAVEQIYAARARQA